MSPTCPAISTTFVSSRSAAIPRLLSDEICPLIPDFLLDFQNGDWSHLGRLSRAAILRAKNIMIGSAFSTLTSPVLTSSVIRFPPGLFSRLRDAFPYEFTPLFLILCHAPHYGWDLPAAICSMKSVPIRTSIRHPGQCGMPNVGWEVVAESGLTMSSPSTTLRRAGQFWRATGQSLWSGHHLLT